MRVTRYSLSSAFIAFLVAIGGHLSLASEAVPESQAIKEIEAHVATLTERKTKIDSLYPKVDDLGLLYATFARLLKEEDAINSSGTSRDRLVLYGATWGSWFGLNYHYVTRELYRYHLGALEQSLRNARYIEAARRAELDHLAKGVREWGEYEAGFAKVVEEAIQAQAAVLALEYKQQAAEKGAYDCVDDACREAANARVAQLKSEKRKASEASERAGEKMANYTRHFFDPVGSLRVRLKVADQLWSQGGREAAHAVEEARTLLATIEAKLAKDSSDLKRAMNDDGERHKEAKKLVAEVQSVEAKMKAEATAFKNKHRRAPDLDDLMAAQSDPFSTARELSKLYFDQLVPRAIRYKELAKADEPYHAQLAERQAKIQAEVQSRDEGQVKYAQLQTERLKVILSPSIEEVRISANGSPVYKAGFEPPDAELMAKLEILEQAIALTKAVIEEAKPEHDAAFAEYKKAHAASVRALTDVRGAIWKNSLLQFATEALFQLYDVAKAGSERGAPGALAEAVLKIVENCVKWASDELYQYELFEGVDPGSIQAEMNAQAMADLTDPTASQQLAKTALMDGAQDLISGRAKDSVYVAFRSIKPTATLKEFVTGSESLKTNLTGMLKEVGKLKGARLEKYGLSQLGDTVTKEILKSGMQKMQNEIEVAAWRKFFEAEVRLQVTFRTYRLSNQVYQQARAVLEQAEAEKREFLDHHIEAGRDYITKVLEDRPFEKRADLAIEVQSKPLKSKWRLAVDVLDQKVSGDAQNTFTYTVPETAELFIDVFVRTTPELTAP